MAKGNTAPNISQCNRARAGSAIHRRRELTVTAPTRFPARVKTTELNDQQTAVSSAAISPIRFVMLHALEKWIQERGL